MTATDQSNPLLQKRHSLEIFSWAVAISLVVHLVASLVLVLPGGRSVPAVPSFYVDLQSMAAPAEPAADQPLLPESPAEPAAEPMPEATPEAARLEKSIESTLQKAAVTPEAVHESAIGLGMVSGRFTSFAEGETLKDEIRVYYFELMRRINEFWWSSGAGRDLFTDPASVNLLISRDGKVLACSLFESTGNREKDQALLEAIKKAQPLPPLPRSFPQMTFNAPIRFVPPLRLMMPGFGQKKVTTHQQFMAN